MSLSVDDEVVEDGGDGAVSLVPVWKAASDTRLKCWRFRPGTRPRTL